MSRIRTRTTCMPWTSRVVLALGLAALCGLLTPSAQAALEVRIAFNNGAGSGADSFTYVAYSGPINLSTSTGGIFSGTITASSDLLNLNVSSVGNISTAFNGAQLYISFRDISANATPRSGVSNLALNVSAGSTLGGAAMGVLIGAMYLTNPGSLPPSFIANAPASAVPANYPIGTELINRVTSTNSTDTVGPTPITLGTPNYEMRTDIIIGAATTDRFSFSATTNVLIVPEPSTLAVALTAAPILAGAAWLRRRRQSRASA